MTISKYQVRRGAYYDSVMLMQLQRALLSLPGVVDAGVVMATPANRELLAANDLLPEAAAVSPDDLLIVVKAQSDAAATDALAQVDALLARRRSSDQHDFRPHSLRAAANQLPAASWVLISVPGRYAAGVAREALDLEKHVFLYSDNVSLEDEISLKGIAQSKGLLVMGPDCGTAIINGIGLGFANRVRRGAIGLVGAAGTGLQAVSTHIHEFGGGISQAIGTGGRDLKGAVGAVTAHQALDVLARDPDTKVIVLISKPPSPEVVTGLLSSAQAAGKPVVVDFIGYPLPARRLGNLHFSTSLQEAARLAVELEKSGAATVPTPVSDLYLRGLFSGGTLAYETLLALQTVLSPIYSNAPIREERQLPDPLKSQGHCIIDLGDEFFMVGRLHPMIDNDLRIRRMRQEAADPKVGMILLDVVLGESAHPDPASELAPVVAELKRPGLEFVVVLIGTEDDPQGLDRQAQQLREAGALVFRSVTEVVEHANARLGRRERSHHPQVALESLTRPFAAINVGLESFYSSLLSQGAEAVQMDWRPPAGGNEKLASILARMKT